MSTDDELAAAVRAALSAAANPERAVQQQAYLKSTMPCHGVGNPTVRMIVRNACAQRPELTRDEWIAAIRSLWTSAYFPNLKPTHSMFLPVDSCLI